MHLTHDQRIAGGIFVLTFVAFAFFFGGGGWNQNAGLDLTHAVVERGTLYVDGYSTNTGDLSRGRHGHAYINKPPGTSLLGVAPYAVAYFIEKKLHADTDGMPVMTFNAWLDTVAVCGLSGALIAALVYASLRRMAGRDGKIAAGIALTIAFGTIVMPYSTVFFAHVPAALFLLVAFLWRDTRPLLAGASAGLAGITIYFCIPAALVILALIAVHSRKNAMLFVAGAVPFALLLAWYHTRCFGAPWRTSVEGSGLFVDPNRVLGVFGKPSIEALWGLTFSPYRGLFFCSPVLLAAFAGSAVMIRRRLFRGELVAIAAIFIVFLVATASFNGWHGGSAFGPRYMLPAVPLLAIPLAFVPRRLLRLCVVLAIVSIAINFLATAVDPEPGAQLRNPLRQYILPPFVSGHLPAETVRLLNLPTDHVGKVSINAQSVDAIGPYLVHPLGSREAEWASFNLGEFVFGSGSRSSVLPVVVWMIGGAFILIRAAGRVPRV